MPETYEPCGRGICAANEGHEGTCEEASGWAEFDAADTVSAPSKPDQSLDVIEQAARAIHDTACDCGDPHPCDYAAAHAVAAAHLLVDPADRDEYRKGFYEGADAIIRDELADPADKANEAFTWRERALHWKSDKERAEAEVARLKTVVDRLPDRLSMAKVNQRQAETEAAHAVCDQLTAEAERDKLAAQVERVRAIHEHRHDPAVSDDWCVEESADWPVRPSARSGVTPMCDEDLRGRVYVTVAHEAFGILYEDECTQVTDALMPIIREALAEAWDAGCRASDADLIAALADPEPDTPRSRNPWRGER